MRKRGLSLSSIRVWRNSYQGISSSRAIAKDGVSLSDGRDEGEVAEEEALCGEEDVWERLALAKERTAGRSGLASAGDGEEALVAAEEGWVAVATGCGRGAGVGAAVGRKAVDWPRKMFPKEEYREDVEGRGEAAEAIGVREGGEAVATEEGLVAADAADAVARVDTGVAV